MNQFKESLQDLKTLKAEFKKVVEEQRIKLEIIREIADNLSCPQEEEKELTRALKVETEKNKALTDIPCPLHKGSTAEKILSHVAVSFQPAVTRCLKKYPKLQITKDGIECPSCRDDFSVAGLQVQPPYRISFNIGLEFATDRHMKLSERHHVL